MARDVLRFDQDQHVLELIRSGDRAGLMRLYDDNRRPIVSHVTRNGGSADEAEDVLQESVVIVWEKVRTGGFELTARLTTFTFAVARRLWLRKLAQHRREPAVDLDPDGLSDDPQAEPPDVDERIDSMRLAFDRLGEPCRTLLLLFYWEELTMAEVARQLGFANADVAKAKKYQCKEQLRRLMAGDDRD
ncbi:MAG: sigma-70 family RNA polymerase sigma factor [Bacteroidetes bacterium]|jgi:RNA polymerase sigma factor (sigma-70 family)|nr:sigma-70 family RNA polymerase sigma factor [Bacteroidota bacterium]